VRFYTPDTNCCATDKSPIQPADKLGTVSTPVPPLQQGDAIRGSTDRKECTMYSDFDDDVFLSPETLVSVPHDQDQDDALVLEAMETLERNAWARHALRSSGFAGAVAANDLDEDEDAARHAIRHVLALRWD
jgi:hypothetical protein